MRNINQKDHLLTGDVLFFLYKKNNDLFQKEIADLITGYNGFLIYHVALYLENRRICESTVENGVSQRNLNVKDESFLIGRVLDRKIAQQSANIVLRWIGRPYNYSFKKNSIGYYCSELICEAYKYANQGISFFKEEPLIFGKKSLDYWKKYYSNLNEKIPYHEYGSHPASLSLDPKFKIIE